ncbi:hypothetical protein PTTG_28717 [Puccinia triticina 1-1 BBBD Race 1]|uniref:Glyco_transf_28 domain-containing protein n=2 Tax=Puccinia triticina TaxID=208348 RepID=A0A180GA19_PUCT1|nr:uncharacterized protein PtA15_13A435 [Puccinia triticina]OAV89338.1 hypothetical protein PTTG_28717 [Puccinia triticina 1-1 BBBD Race 1]WAQ91035.1 hypothetical protein PtA15_13A435 [Puccinia triticina]
MRAGQITWIFFSILLFLNLPFLAVPLPSILKSSFGSLDAAGSFGAATSLSKSASTKLLDSKNILSPTDPSIETLKTDSKPKKITCLTIGSRGDVQPYIALCQGLIAKGHTCTIATHEKFGGWIKQNGIGFRPVAGDPEELIRHCTANGKDLMALTECSWEACQGSDLLIESPSAMAGVHIAQALNIPYIRAFTMPWTKTGVYPHAMAAMGKSWGAWMNRLSYKLFDGITWLLTRKEINLWRENYLRLQRTTLAELKLSEVPFLYNFSSHVAPKPTDWGHLIQVTGYWYVKPTHNEASVSNDLKQAIDNARKQGKKIVYIGFGSIIVPDPKKMTDAIVGAVEESNVFAIISGGWTAGAAEGATKGATEVMAEGTTEAAKIVPKKAEMDAEDATAYMKRKIGERSSSMHYVDSVPHDWLFPQISAALHHGGAGTTAASIRGKHFGA